MIAINIDEPMKTQARSMSDKTIANLKKVSNYTGLESEDRYYIGAIGELGFKALLEQKEIKFDYRPRQDGESDSGDFAVFGTSSVAIVDVKTASKPTHKNLMVPAKQLERVGHYTYIGARIVDSVIEFHGYCYQEDFEPSTIPGLKIKTMQVSFDKLHSISDWIERMK